MANVGLDNNDLNHVWALADADRDGKLTRLEFGVAMHLAACTVRKKMQLPDVLPKCLAVNTDTESLNPALEAGGTRFSVSLKASGTGDWYGIAPESRERTATGETTGSGKEGRRADRSIRKSEADEDRTTVEDNLYAMSETERAQYDIIFMQVRTQARGLRYTEKRIVRSSRCCAHSSFRRRSTCLTSTGTDYSCFEYLRPPLLQDKMAWSSSHEA